jgi:hypothetical protein
MRKSMMLVAVGALAAATTTAVRADEKKDKDKDSPASAWIVELDFGETPSGKSGDAHVLVAVPLVEHGCSEASAWHGAVNYHVRVCEDDRGGGVVSFEADRDERRGDKGPIEQQRFKGEVRLATGKKALVGRLTHPDGAATLVSMTVTEQ